MKTKKIIAIFFSLGMGCDLWHKKGLISKNLPYFRELIEEFGEIYLFTFDYKQDLSFLKEPGIKVFPMPVRLPNVLYALIMPFFYLGELKKASLLHTVQMSGAIPALVAKFLLHKPLLLQCGYSWSKFARYAKESFLRVFLIDIIERTAFRNADLIIVTEKSQAEFALRFNKRNKVLVLPNSIDPEKFSPKPSFKTNKKVVFIGRLTEQKNLFNLLEAISLIKDLELDIIGSGEQEGPLKQFAKSIEASINFLGDVSNERIANELPKYNALLLPSFYEGDPKVIIEAMACGVPVVATRVVGTKELIEDRVTGLLCGLSSKDIAGALKTVLEDKGLASNLSKNAREYVLLHRNFNINAKRQIEVTRSLLR
ncbi:MAG: glycosyltransferase [Candidatus Omnitrophota bacterium]